MTLYRARCGYELTSCHYPRCAEPPTHAILAMGSALPICSEHARVNMPAHDAGRLVLVVLSAGHLILLGDVEYYRKNVGIYRAPLSTPLNRYGFRPGEWVCHEYREFEVLAQLAPLLPER